ncbi:MAG: D-serine dehydratase [delta proteobacterium ML8_F1]|nr:MAG: D-serine dehydratase [delta proteobacterium ML8_F1]
MEPLEQLKQRLEVFWENTSLKEAARAFQTIPLKESDILEANARLMRFKPLIQKIFPETLPREGLIESDLVDISKTYQRISLSEAIPSRGRYLLKADSHLPVSGSIKARGGIYEVLAFAEKTALDAGLLSLEDNYAKLLEPLARDLFSHYTLAVGSTGNLGLSIGIMGAALNFKVTVHMSSDARAWKKNLLRSKGVQVMEYDSDYSLAVKMGREQSQKDPTVHFVDDENSQTLFLGYATAALRLKDQLRALDIEVSPARPLFVYLPCGVGGAPGGLAFGLKKIFGDSVSVFFAEPVESPAMFLGVLTQKHDAISVQEIGLSNRTDADGLAVGRPSGFVGRTVGHLINGFYTVKDEALYPYLQALYSADGIPVEPSAAISLAGPGRLRSAGYFKTHHLDEQAITHLAWATGGGMVPREDFKSWLKK